MSEPAFDPHLQPRLQCRARPDGSHVFIRISGRALVWISLAFLMPWIVGIRNRLTTSSGTAPDSEPSTVSSEQRSASLATCLQHLQHVNLVQWARLAANLSGDHRWIRLVRLGTVQPDCKRAQSSGDGQWAGGSRRGVHGRPDPIWVCESQRPQQLIGQICTDRLVWRRGARISKGAVSHTYGPSLDQVSQRRSSRHSSSIRARRHTGSDPETVERVWRIKVRCCCRIWSYFRPSSCESCS